MGTNILAGGLTGAITALPAYPLYYLRIRLTMDVGVGVDASQSEKKSKGKFWFN